MQQEIILILKKSLVKGVLVSVILFLVAMIINTAVIALWYNNYEGELTNFHWATLSLLGGIFPIIAHVLFGLFRSFKVLYSSAYFELFKPKLSVAITTALEKHSEKIDFAEKSTDDLSESITTKVWDTIDSLLTPFPSWVRKSVFWMLGKVSLRMKFLEFSKTVQNLSPKQISNKLDEFFADLVDKAKPFWMNLLLPTHIGLLIAIWFI